MSSISIKATMHSLYDRPDPIPTLYVRSLASFSGPEYSIKHIFSKARHQAPCFLVFEDLDSIVSDEVRSYFLNEVDGLQENDGILMVSTFYWDFYPSVSFIFASKTCFTRLLVDDIWFPRSCPRNTFFGTSPTSKRAFVRCFAPINSHTLPPRSHNLVPPSLPHLHAPTINPPFQKQH